MTTQAGVDDEAALILPFVFPYVSTCTANGQTTYAVDTALFKDPNDLAMVSQHLNTAWIYFPNDSTAADRERVIGGNSGNAIDLDEGRIYPINAWSDAPQSGDRYLITTIQPSLLHNLKKASLHRFPLPVLRPLIVFTDADMETSGVTNYTISGAGAITKVTTAANVNTGRQSMFFNAATAAEYVETPSVQVSDAEQYFTSVNIRVDAGGPFEFAIWDKTNNAEIDSGNRVTTSHERFRSLRRTFTPPSGCEEVALRVYCTNNTDDAYIDYFSGPYKASDKVIGFTSLITRASQVRKILTARYAQDDGETRDASSRSFSEVNRRVIDYDIRINPSDVHSARLEFKPGSSLPMEELWVEQIVRADAYYTLAFTAAGESSPDVGINKRLWALAWCRDICTHLLTNDPGHEKAQRARDEIDAELGPLMKDYAEQDLQTPSTPPRMHVARIGAN